MKEWKLLEPIKVGNKVLRNRIVMPPMETRLSNFDGSSTEKLAEHYGRRAQGGASMIIVESTFIDNKSSRGSLVSSGLSSDHHIAGKYLVSQAIKEQGAIAIIQICHAGRQARVSATGLQPVAPSDVPYGGVEPHVLTIPEIIEIEDFFADAAERAKISGFDGVEIHGAHGYLITEFLSPYTNKRSDEYGGTPEKRGTFPRNIINKVRAKVGKDFILGFRISGAEFVDGGLTIEDTTAFVKTIENDIDYINVSAGIYETMATHLITPMYIPQAPIADLAAKMKEAVNIPVIAVGALNTEIGEKLLQENKADIIAFGRSLLVDPDLPTKIKENRIEDIKPCMRGHEGCVSLFFAGCPIRCELNPQVGRDKEYEVKKAENPRNVVVIGGGMAGMEAARLADEMGHKVTLFEKSSELGGHFIEATEPDFKKEGRGVVSWAKTQLKKSNVDVKMNQVATSDTIKAIKPDVVIVATGSDYIRLPIDGIHKALSPDVVLFDSDKAKDTVAIIGGGLIGSETALHLATKNKKVAIFEMRGDIVLEDEPLSQAAIKMKLSENNVDVHTNAKVLKILEDGILFESNGEESKFDAKTVVFATGLGSRPTVEFDNIAPQVFKIGDAVAGRKIFNALHDAWFAVRNIK